MNFSDLKKLIEKFNDINDVRHDKNIAEITDYLEQCVLSKLAVFISEKRKEKGLSVREVNERSRVSLAVINDLEKARSMPRVETLIRLALALEIDFNEVFEKMKILEMTVKNKTTNKNEKIDLALDISKYGYDKNQISEIMDFIKFIDFKTTLKDKK